MSKSDAITWYETGTATLAVPFPNGKTVCQWCPYVRTEDSLKRHRCLLTGEYLMFPFTSRGNECPVMFDNGEESEDDGTLPPLDL